MKHKNTILLMLFVAIGMLCFAQTTGDYRSKATGNWNALTTWERYNGSSWVEPTAVQGTPTSSIGVITIISPNVVTITAGVSIDQVTVDSGAQITVNTGVNVTVANGSGTDLTVSGLLKNAGTITTTGSVLFSGTGKYQHNWPAGTVGTIPTATWNDGSICEIINMSGTGGTTKLQGTSQSFYDFYWNCTGQSQPVYIRGDSFRPVRHDFKMQSTGTSKVEVSGVEGGPTWRFDFTNYIQTGGNFTITREMSGAPNYTINVAGNFSMSGGTLTTSTAYATLNFNGTSGTQTFSKTSGTLSGTINFSVASGSTLDVGNSVITGSGSFTLNSGASLITANTNGITSSGASGSIQVSGTRTYNSGANYTYNGTASQYTGNGITGANNLTLNNSAGITFSGSVTISGLYTHNNGSISGTTPSVDGYASQNHVYLNIAENGTQITGFSASTSVGSNMPAKINRQWAITGSFAGNKTATFYWDASDDDNFSWGAVVPSVYKGATEYTQTAYDVSSDPRWVTVSLPSFDAKATYTIGAAGDETLPVELSSFTAILTADLFVKLHWVTQSESGVSGYYIYRAEANDLGSATLISPMIMATNSTDTQHYEYSDNEIFEPGTYYYWLQVQDQDGGVYFHGPTTVYFDNSQTNGIPGIPVVTGFTSIYPNPFNPKTTISYGITKAGDVSFSIYNQRGQLVKTLNDPQKAIGYWKLEWDGTDSNGQICPTGIYYIRMQAGSESYLRKAILLK